LIAHNILLPQLQLILGIAGNIFEDTTDVAAVAESIFDCSKAELYEYSDILAICEQHVEKLSNPRQDLIDQGDVCFKLRITSDVVAFFIHCAVLFTEENTALQRGYSPGVHVKVERTPSKVKKITVKQQTQDSNDSESDDRDSSQQSRGKGESTSARKVSCPLPQTGQDQSRGDSRHERHVGTHEMYLERYSSNDKDNSRGLSGGGGRIPSPFQSTSSTIVAQGSQSPRQRISSQTSPGFSSTSAHHSFKSTNLVQGNLQTSHIRFSLILVLPSPFHLFTS